jgi:hypothetical protein
MALALHQYHDNVKCFPPGYVQVDAGATSSVPGFPPFRSGGRRARLIDRPTARPPIVPTAPGWGWAAFLLPYLEQGTLARQINWEHPVEDTRNASTRLTTLTIYTCPADRETGIFQVVDAGMQPVAKAATNSYAACYGQGTPILITPGNGIFHVNGTTRIRDVIDGTSSTLSIGERAALFTQTPWAGAMYMGTCRITPGAPVYTSIMEGTPSMVMARIGRRVLNDPFSEPYDFFSPHPGLVMFAFADATVHALHSGIEPIVLQALATHAGGETHDFRD